MNNLKLPDFSEKQDVLYAVLDWFLEDKPNVEEVTYGDLRKDIAENVEGAKLYNASYSFSNHTSGASQIILKFENTTVNHIISQLEKLGYDREDADLYIKTPAALYDQFPAIDKYVNKEHENVRKTDVQVWYPGLAGLSVFNYDSDKIAPGDY